MYCHTIGRNWKSNAKLTKGNSLEYENRVRVSKYYVCIRLDRLSKTFINRKTACRFRMDNVDFCIFFNKDLCRH